jgi:tetratricopeptide (TPR) repeat protein
MPEPEDPPLHPDDPSVRRRLEAARGYCELGLPELAWDEMAPLRQPLGHCGAVIEMDLMILMTEKRWTEALALALRLQQLHPSQPAGWLQASYCLHELGRTREALEGLVSGPRALREVPLFHYNTGCYLARLGKLRDAMASLRRAFEMDAEYLENARTDPDLAALRDQL